MGMFSNRKETEMLRDTEAKAASLSRDRADQATASGGTVNGIDANGWAQRAETFQNAADDYQRQLDRKKR